MEPNDNLPARDPETGLPVKDFDTTPEGEAKTVTEDDPTAKSRNYGNRQMDDIYNNSRATRDAQIADPDNPASDLIERLEAEAAGEEPPDQTAAGDVDEEAAAAARLIQEQQQEDQANAATRQDAPQSGQQDQPSVENDDGFVYIKVDGENQVATLGEIREAGGVEALQKSRSSEQRFQEAATERRRAEALMDEVRTLIPQFIREERANQAPTTDGVPRTDRPSPAGEAGVTGQDVAESIFSGDTEDAGKKLEQIIAAAAGKTTVEGSSPRDDELASKLMNRLGLSEHDQRPSNVRSPEQDLANQTYAQSFPDLVEAAESRPEIIEYGKREMARRRSDPLNAGKSLSQIALEVGADARQRYMPPAGARELSADEIGLVVEKKRRLRGTTTTAAPSRAPTDGQPEKSPNIEQSRQNAFADIKKARGQ
jgi:hypothetical protein